MSALPLAPKYGKLTPLAPVGPRGGQYRVRCDCGAETIVRTRNLHNGHTKSCGCGRVEALAPYQKTPTHGMKRTPTHNSWAAMRQRCFDRNHKDYKNYGGRGITVCARWDSFENFLVDMGVRPWGMTLDREDSDGNYEPGNCKWSTDHEQNNNRRCCRRLTVGNTTKTLSQWATDAGVSVIRLTRRLNKGWSPAEALADLRAA